jgi:hypothetical protein
MIIRLEVLRQKHLIKGANQGAVSVASRTVDKIPLSFSMLHRSMASYEGRKGMGRNSIIVTLKWTNERLLHKLKIVC